MSGPQVGDALPEWVLDPVSPERMKVMAAVLRDPNPIHWDRAELVARGLPPRLINQGPINLGYVTNMLEAWVGRGAIRRLEARFTSNVLEGDRVRAGGTVVGVRAQDGRRLIDCEVWLDVDGRGRAVEGTATVEPSTSAGDGEHER
jgi:acyl dehydratase